MRGQGPRGQVLTVVYRDTYVVLLQIPTVMARGTSVRFAEGAAAPPADSMSLHIPPIGISPYYSYRDYSYRCLQITPIEIPTCFLLHEVQSFFQSQLLVVPDALLLFLC